MIRLKRFSEWGDSMARMTLRAARVNADLDQKTAAKKIGVSNKTLCAWENGKSYPKADKLGIICDIYGIAFDDLIFLTDKAL